MLEKFLQEIGLSEKESLVYIHLLKVDSDSIANISKATSINRTTIYPILEQLIEKEFVDEIKENEKSLYVACSPERIESYLAEQKIKIEEQTHVANDIIPQLKGIMREGGQKPIIEYFEGREAISEAAKNYYESTDKDGEAYLIYPRDELENLFSDKEREEAKKLRLNKNIGLKFIYTYKKGEYQSDPTGEGHRIDEKEYPVSCDIGIYADRVRIYILGEKLGTVYIKSKDIADTLRTLFKLALKGLEK